MSVRALSSPRCGDRSVVLFGNGTNQTQLLTPQLFRLSCSSKDRGASVVYGATDLQDDHNQQVQEETGAAHGLLEDVSLSYSLRPVGI